MRPTSAARTRVLLADLAQALGSPRRRWLVLGLAVASVLVVQFAAGASGAAWLFPLVAVAAGATGGPREGVVVAVLAASLQALVDLQAGPVASAPVAESILRGAVLVLLALVGAGARDAEQQRLRAVDRSAREDAVTGLLNVRSFYDALGASMAAGTPVTVLLADIRGMRPLNETHGHPTGTEAIRVVAHVLRSVTGEGLVASRLGSDEVAVALVGDRVEDVDQLVATITAGLADEPIVLPDGTRSVVHVAIGVARAPEDGDSVVAVLNAADRARRHAKTLGLDGVARADRLPPSVSSG
jgi:diguanylate cyclase (GGDEF)-like protein